MAAAFWVTLSLIGLVCGLRIMAGMGRAHHRRWEASEPECYMPELKPVNLRREVNAWETIAGHADTVDELIEASR